MCAWGGGTARLSGAPCVGSSFFVFWLFFRWLLVRLCHFLPPRQSFRPEKDSLSSCRIGRFAARNQAGPVKRTSPVCARRDGEAPLSGALPWIQSLSSVKRSDKDDLFVVFWLCVTRRKSLSFGEETTKRPKETLPCLCGEAENSSPEISIVTSDISVSKINLVSVTVLCVTGSFFVFIVFHFWNTFSVSVSVVSFQIILISVSVLVFISVSWFIILINKSIILILELTMLHNSNLALAGISTSLLFIQSYRHTKSLFGFRNTRISRFLDSLFLRPAVSHPHTENTRYT